MNRFRTVVYAAALLLPLVMLGCQSDGDTASPNAPEGMSDQTGLDNQAIEAVTRVLIDEGFVAAREHAPRKVYRKATDEGVVTVTVRARPAMETGEEVGFSVETTSPALEGYADRLSAELERAIRSAR
ncbi:MAG: hypothetical protein ACLFV3_05805 [Phycisphaeraceae bacterium]